MSEWISTETALPEDPDTQVLVVVCGCPKENITLLNAVFIADYSPEDGWIIEGHEDWRDFDVKYWREIPKSPMEVCDASEGT